MIQHGTFLLLKLLWHVFVTFYVCWVMFLAVMNLKASRDGKRLSLPALIFGSPLLWVGLVLDCGINVVILTVLGCELPQEGTITYRLSRWKKVTDVEIAMLSGYRGRLWAKRVRQYIWIWRRWFASYVCTNFLDGFDDGECHCK